MAFSLKNIFGLSNPLILSTQPRPKKINYKDLTPEVLINREGRIGASLFEKTDMMKVLNFHVEGPENKDWYFHFVVGADRFVTNHYTILNDRVIKAISDTKMNPNNQDSVRFSDVEPEELANFMKATRMYHDKVLKELYNRDPKTGRLFSQLI
jgi:hypothetical protein